ncbi:hypothetical protein NPIL_364391 [Nephila pilipes]|uniref:Uncharacterized protein n=1 Tax=Nephila pilipes TaxID=299642 RepID=A0A8X6UBS2_NEPPI|nr:hypothetical protein NPIL_364391 [Nephila pilipes]
MKRMSSFMIVSSKRMCFNYDNKENSSFSDDAVPLHHFHLDQDIYAAVTYFANVVQIHLPQCRRNENNRLFPTKRDDMTNPDFIIDTHGLFEMERSNYKLVFKLSRRKELCQNDDLCKII